MKFSQLSLKLGKKVAPIDLSAPQRRAQEDSTKQAIQSMVDSRVSSNTSVLSTASSKKVAWMLGPEAIRDLQTDSETVVSSTTSVLINDKAGESRRSSPFLYDELMHAKSVPDDTDDSQSDSDSDSGSIIVDERVVAELGSQGETHSMAENIQSFQFGFAIEQIQHVDQASHSIPIFNKIPITKIPTAASTSAPSSPDVEGLEVSKFSAPLARVSSEYDTAEPIPSIQTVSRLELLEPSVDFDVICKRLRESLDSANTQDLRPVLNHSPTESTISSSQSSAKLFSEPPTPSVASSSSSLNSLNSFSRDESLEDTKMSLVTDQAALEAKLKLAAARDALKRVKSNIISPVTASFHPSVLSQPDGRNLSMSQIPGRHLRTSSSGTIPRGAPISMPASRSSPALDKLVDDRAAPRSSRSSRATGRDNRSMTSKSDVKIGFSAPKNLDLLRQPEKRTQGPQAGSKAKASVYIPQGHITSINEVLA